MKNNLNKVSFALKLCFVIGSFAFILYDMHERTTSVPVALDTTLASSVASGTYEQIVLAGGCFWSTEGEYDHLDGVVSAVSGYADANKQYPRGSGPTYEEVSSGEVDARESVLVTYDPKKITTKKILEVYFKSIDPTDEGGQFFDRGFQYTSAIYYMNEEQHMEANALIARITASKKFPKLVAVGVLPYTTFYPAEEYHQHFKDKNPVRYRIYREGSGRDLYFKTTWSDISPHVKEIFEDTSTSTSTIHNTMQKNTNTPMWKTFTDRQKKERLKALTPLQFYVTQENGTEPPFANAYYNNEEKGIYVDIVSGEPLFLSSDKYDSGTGWPSFVKPVDYTHVILEEDDSISESRTEVKSALAHSHLGHVFDDGPADRGGKRYCMDSAALRFIPLADMDKEGYGEFVLRIK